MQWELLVMLVPLVVLFVAGILYWAHKMPT